MDLKNNQQTLIRPLPSGLEALGPVVPPPLTQPPEDCPSVLVTEAKSSNALTVRYSALFLIAFSDFSAVGSVAVPHFLFHLNRVTFTFKKSHLARQAVTPPGLGMVT